MGLVVLLLVGAGLAALLLWLARRFGPPGVDGPDVPPPGSI